MDWKHCISIYMDGARSMQGSKKGFAAFVLGINLDVKVVHCSIYRKAPMSKCVPKALKVVLEDVINIVNFIISSGSRSSIFANLCESMEGEFSCLLYHTEVHWLSKGKVLARMMTLRRRYSYFWVITKKFWFSQQQKVMDRCEISQRCFWETKFADHRRNHRFPG